MTKKQLNNDRKKARANLRERVKEQECLYDISTLDESSIEKLLERAVALIPQGLQHPEMTAASIEFENQVFSNENYCDTDWKLTAKRNCLNGGELKIHVVSLKHFSVFGNGHFIKEEEQLIDTIAGHLALKIDQLLSGKKLQEKERRLERMSTMARIGYWDIDLQDNLVYWSDMTKQIFEVNDDFVPDLESAYSFYKEGKDRDTIVQAVNNAIIKGEPFDVELQIITAKGMECWVRSIGDPQMNEEGICVRLDGSFQDINDRKQIQFESERSRLLLETISDKTESAIWVRDSEGRHIFVNNKWKKIFELEDQQVYGKTAFEILDKTTAAEFRNNDKKVLSSNQTVKYEEKVLTSQGNRYYLTNMFPLIDIPDVGKGVAGFATDITERKANEQQIKNSLKEKELLLGEIHHRVKNNLAMISSLINIQMMDVGDEYFKTLLESTDNRIQSIAMVHELLYQSENFSEIPFETYINNLLSTIKKTIDIERISLNLVTNVKVDGLNINQAIPLGLLFNELMTNSLKYAFIERSKGKITISITRSGNNLKVVYEDDGVGYPDHLDFKSSGGFGHTLIHTLLMQLSRDFDVETNGKFRLEFQFEEGKKGAHSNHSGIIE